MQTQALHSNSSDSSSPSRSSLSVSCLPLCALFFIPSFRSTVIPCLSWGAGESRRSALWLEPASYGELTVGDIDCCTSSSFASASSACCISLAMRIGHVNFTGLVSFSTCSS